MTNRVLLRCSAKNQTEKFSLFQDTPTYSIQGTNTISIHPQQTSIFQVEEIHATDSFTFDAILNERTQTKTIYSEYVKPMLSDILMRNIHGTVIVSGSRRAGKSFTLFGLDSGFLNYFHEDLIIEEGKNPMKVSFSFFDMKSEKIHDLLNPKCDEVEVRERTSGEVYLKNLTEVVLEDLQEFPKYFRNGITNRSIHQTFTGTRSTYTTTFIRFNFFHPETNERMSSMTFIELPGPSQVLVEKSRSSLAPDPLVNDPMLRYRLSKQQNERRSFLTLSKVITQLVESRKNSLNPHESAKKKKFFAPYRDSKLTRLLRPMLEAITRSDPLPNDNNKPAGKENPEESDAKSKDCHSLTFIAVFPVVDDTSREETMEVLRLADQCRTLLRLYQPISPALQSPPIRLSQEVDKSHSEALESTEHFFLQQLEEKDRLLLQRQPQPDNPRTLQNGKESEMMEANEGNAVGKNEEGKEEQANSEKGKVQQDQSREEGEEGDTYEDETWENEVEGP